MTTKISTILLLILLLPFPLLAKPPKAKRLAPKTESTEKGEKIEKAEKVEQFSELKLHGQLKRPELNYRFEDEMAQELKAIEVPRNFDHELVQDIERR